MNKRVALSPEELDAIIAEYDPEIGYDRCWTYDDVYRFAVALKEAWAVTHNSAVKAEENQRRAYDCGVIHGKAEGAVEEREEIADMVMNFEAPRSDHENIRLSNVRDFAEAIRARGKSEP